jgi:hypothetical protein
MPNFASCALHVLCSKTVLDNEQNNIIESFVQVLHADLPYFENFSATRVNDGYLRLCFNTKESHASAVWPPLSHLSGVADSDTLVFLLTFANDSYSWNDCCAKIQVFRDDGDERVSDLPHLSQDEFAEGVKRFAAVLVALWQDEDPPSSYEIDCTAVLEKVERLPPKETTRNALQARHCALDDLDIL